MPITSLRKMPEERHIHYHIRQDSFSGGIFLFVLQYHYDCEVIVVDKVGAHPLLINGLVGENILEEDQVITNEIYNDVIFMLHSDGIC